MKFRVLAIFIGLGVISGVIACQSPTEGDAPPPATATASALQSTTPISEPATAVVKESCLSEEGFRFGATVLTRYEGAGVYEEADPDSRRLTVTDYRDNIEIIGNAVCVDDYIWWEVEYRGKDGRERGWTMEANLILPPLRHCDSDWRPEASDAHRWATFSEFALLYQDLVVQTLILRSGDPEAYTASFNQQQIALEAIWEIPCGKYLQLPDFLQQQ
jgi:hypothetical protein